MTDTVISGQRFVRVRDQRVKSPEAIADALAKRRRRPLPADGRVFIVAADHPARGAIDVGDEPGAMADRYDLLDRLELALARPGVDGVLGTPDIIEDLALLGALDNKLVIGSMNRGGIAGSSFEIDDRMTGYDIAAAGRDGLDFVKTLLRINLEDSVTPAALETNSRTVSAAAAAGLPIMLEPFMNEWQDGKATNVLTTDAVIKSVGIASALGNTSAYTWLKLPVVADMERVAAATTLPIVLLGGERSDDQQAAFACWQHALGLPGVRGLVAGRSLIYPADGNVEAAVRTAAELVHAGTE